jgi:hypothetical protein
MLRNLLGVVAALALPSVLVGQAPTPPNPAAGLARPHGIATQIQGEVVSARKAPRGVDLANTLDGPHEARGAHTHGDLEAGDHVDRGGDLEDVNPHDTPAPPPGTAHVRMNGRHRP